MNLMELKTSKTDVNKSSSTLAADARFDATLSKAIMESVTHYFGEPAIRKKSISEFMQQVNAIIELAEEGIIDKELSELMLENIAKHLVREGLDNLAGDLFSKDSNYRNYLNIRQEQTDIKLSIT